MLNFYDQYEIKLRKDCEIHNLYLMNDRLIVMLIYFDEKYYFDIIKDNVKRDLIYITLKPGFIVRIGQQSLGIIANDDTDQNILYVFDANNYSLYQTKIKFKEIPLSYIYFCQSETAILLAYSQEGKLTGLILNQQKEKIKRIFYETEEEKVFNCYQIDQQERLIIKFSNNSSQKQSLYLYQFNGSIAQINSKFLEGFVLNGSALSDSYFLLFQTPLQPVSSFIELIDQAFNSVKVINFTQYDFLYSIEQICYFDDQSIWCKMTTDIAEETEYLIVFDKYELKIVDEIIYQQFIPLQIACSNNTLIEQSFNIMERTHIIILKDLVSFDNKTNHKQVNQEVQVVLNYEIFDDYAEIIVHFNPNPLFQVYKIMKSTNIENSLIEEILQKMITNFNVNVINQK